MDRQLPRASHQHHRHARPRRLHHRGRALHAGARRRVHGVRLRGRRAAAVRDGVAPGGQVRRAAPCVRQQDGPRRRRLLQGLPPDEGAPARQSRADPDPDRRRGQFPGRGRPRAHEGDLLGRGEPGHEVRVPRHPRRAARARRRNGARRCSRRPPRPTRSSTQQVPRGRRAVPARRSRRPAQAHDRQRDRADAVRQRLQEQGRAGDARRRHRLHARADRHSAGHGRARERQAGRAQGLATTSPSPASRSRS